MGMVARRTAQPGHIGIASMALALVAWLGWMFSCNAETIPLKPPGVRSLYSITSFSDGRWLMAGGYVRGSDPRNQASFPTNEALIFNPASSNWNNTGGMLADRIAHTATLLANGKVLVVGGAGMIRIPNGASSTELDAAELYDPATGNWRITGAMKRPRSSHAATLLPDGKVLVTGGSSNSLIRLSSAELYDPETERWTNTTPMKFIRGMHTATLLPNGLVLVAGGWNEDHNFCFDAELFDPIRRDWRTTRSMPVQARFFYTADLQTNGLVMFTARAGVNEWEVTNAWEVGKLLYDPSSEEWKAVGPRRPHFVSSTNLDRTLTISPESGREFVASQEIYFTVDSADRAGVTNIQLFRNNHRIAESEDCPMMYTVTNLAAGNYTFVAKAAYANGLASTSSPVRIKLNAGVLEAFLFPGPTEFISTPNVNSSPATLLAGVVGIDPDSLTNLTLNGVSQPLRTGKFSVCVPLNEGENLFVLVAQDKTGATTRAETKVYLDSEPPRISITEPTNGATFNILRVGVRGTFTEKHIREITVNRMPALVRSNTFEAANVFLELGSNRVSAVAEDIAGNLSTNSIIVFRPTDTNAYATDPVKLIAEPKGGFAPLAVSFRVEARIPGQIKRVQYDFDGDRVVDKETTDLRPVTITFTEPGDRYPLVTLETTAGHFSSIGSGNWFFPIPRVCVQEAPALMRELNVADPVDLQATKEGNLYVLSRKLASISEFDPDGKTIRSLAGIGDSPQGLCVDDAGNVYVAMTGSNQVWKYKPAGKMFEADKSFGGRGYIGSTNGSAGAGPAEFNRPFDVAILRESSNKPPFGFIDVVWVSDSGNHRIQKFTGTGDFMGEFGHRGTNLMEFHTPGGMCADTVATICVVDSGNNRVLECHDFGPRAESGHAGAALGELREPLNISLSERGICVADTGNDRIQLFDPAVHWHGSQLSPLNPRIAISAEFGLKRPSAVGWQPNLLEDRIWIADTGNDRVLLVKLPGDNPLRVWNAMKESLLKGDIDGAMTYFASHEAEKYRRSYHAIGTNELQKVFSEISEIKPVEVKRHTAQYRFDQMVQGQLLTFPVEFAKENGKWKIVEY